MSSSVKKQPLTREDSGSAAAEQRLKELGIQLPTPPEPFGIYAEAVQAGNLLFLTGMLPTDGRGAKFIGRVAAGRADLLPLWAGQSANLSACTDASAFLHSLVEEVSEIGEAVIEWSASL